MTSKSLARANTSSSMRTWCAVGSTQRGSSRNASGAHATSFARVFESPLANNVTSWPEVDQRFGQEVNDPFGTSVELRGHAFMKW